MSKNATARLAMALLLCMIPFLVACGHEHVWVDATCTEPRTCSECGETEGDPLGHDFAPATHDAPETCTRCGETRGEPLLYDVPEGFTNDYPFGEFDTYNSFAGENGLGDTMVWLKGTYDNVTTFDLPDVSPGMQMYLALMTDEGGSTWLLQLDWNMYNPVDKYVALEGHSLCVTGQYQGFSELYGAPTILVEKVFDRTTGDVLYSTWFAVAM